jgi:hypothetical protein
MLSTRRPRRAWLRGFRLLVAALCLALPRLAGAAPLLAQDEGGKTYVLQYMFVGMCIVIALAVVCRPAKREERIPEEFDL